MTDPILLRPTDAARLLSVSRRTLAALPVPVVRLGRRLWRYSPDALRAWALEQSRERGDGQAAVGDGLDLPAWERRPVGRGRPRTGTTAGQLCPDEGGGDAAA